MEENIDLSNQSERLNKDAPKLAAVLKEMKEGLDAVRNKVQVLTAKVKENHFPTADGISYLEAKHLLLLSYCQSIVYYLLRKAKGLSIEGHPVVRSLIEIRLFLEKIRPIDKKMEYQIRKLTRDPGIAVETIDTVERKVDATQKTEDLLKYRPNPDMLITKNKDSQDDDAVYRPPKFAPTAPEEDKKSKQEKSAQRRQREILREATQTPYLKYLRDDIEGKPEEVRESVGAESIELVRYRAKRDARERQEEELFQRAPLTKKEKQREKHLLKSRNGLQGLTYGFYDEIKTVPLGDDDMDASGFNNHSSGRKKFNRKRTPIDKTFTKDLELARHLKKTWNWRLADCRSCEGSIPITWRKCC